jgi:hypothetical protein
MTVHTHSTRPGAAQPAAARLAADARESRRPLFLGPTLRAHVDVDGPALRVRAHGRAERRFPLDRVSRVVASTRINWSADALRACLEGAIPIVIVSEKGSPLGSLQPARMRPSRLAEALEELLDYPNWRDIYHCWLRAARMQVLGDWRRARQAAGSPLDPLEYQDLVKRCVYRAESTSATTGTTELWDGAVYSLATETIERWRLPSLLWGSGGEALDLRRDLSDLMELRLRLEVCQGAEGVLKGEATMLLVFHALTDKLKFEAGRAVQSLARRVQEVLAGCR